MKILITGARGYLAAALIPRLKKNHALYLTSLHSDMKIAGLNITPLNLIDYKKIENFVERIKPDIIINTAAISLPDWAEEHQEETYAVNVSAVKNLIKICSKFSIKLVHISTDYVFSGENPPYSENDKPNPINYYGKTKYLAEKAIIDSDLKIKYLICRTTLLYGLKDPHHRKNLFIDFYNKLNNGVEISASTENRTTITYIQDLSKIIKYLIEQNKQGLYNTCGFESVSRYEFALKLAGIFGFDKTLINPSKNHPRKASRPKNSSLDTKKLKNIIDKKTKIRSISENLSLIKKLI